jgi:ABC-type nitrate/sulfonate/bicarbonate transport system substrate-binding protein
MTTPAPLADRVRVVTGVRSIAESVAWMAREGGLFKRLGLEITFPRLETGGPEAVAGLARGDWEFAETGSAPFVQGILDGGDTVMLLAPMEPLSAGTPLLTRPEISAPHQLDGKSIGVLTETGQTAIAVRTALRTWGVTATLVPLGTFGQVYVSLGAGEIDAGALPFDYRFLGPREFGLNVIDTPSPGFVPVAFGCTRSLIRADRRLVAQVVQGCVEAIHFFKTSRSEAIPVLQQFLVFKDRRAVEDAYEFYAPRFQPVPRPSAAGIQSLLRELARRQPSADGLCATDVADTSLLDELERTGFIRALYGGDHP